MTKKLESEDVRKKLDYALGTQNKENIPLIEELVELRQEEALLLGYSSYSEMILERRMAKSPQNVEVFEDDLIGRLIDAGKKDK